LQQKRHRLSLIANDKIPFIQANTLSIDIEPKMMFRIVLLVAFATTACTGFTTPCPTSTTIRTNAGTTTTDLQMSASSFDQKSNDGWTGKPGYVKSSTKSVPSSKQVSKLERMTMKDVMIDPNYYLTYAVALLGPLIMWYHPCKYHVFLPVLFITFCSDRI
jgi:hypothetical protein